MYHYSPSVVMRVMARDQTSDTENLASVMQRDGVRVFTARVSIANRNRLLDIVLNHERGEASRYWSSVYDSFDYFSGGWSDLKERIKSSFQNL